MLSGKFSLKQTLAGARRFFGLSDKKKAIIEKRMEPKKEAVEGYRITRRSKYSKPGKAPVGFGQFQRVRTLNIGRVQSKRFAWADILEARRRAA